MASRLYPAIQHPNVLSVPSTLHNRYPPNHYDLPPNQVPVASVASSIPNGDVSNPLGSSVCALPSLSFTIAAVMPRFIRPITEGKDTGLGSRSNLV